MTVRGTAIDHADSMLGLWLNKTKSSGLPLAYSIASGEREITASQVRGFVEPTVPECIGMQYTRNKKEKRPVQ